MTIRSLMFDETKERDKSKIKITNGGTIEYVDDLSRQSEIVCGTRPMTIEEVKKTGARIQTTKSKSFVEQYLVNANEYIKSIEAKERAEAQSYEMTR